jgi:F0F1-type ATP synthase membrane subunit b/b'
VPVPARSLTDASDPDLGLRGVSTLDDYVAKARQALDQLRPQLDELRVQADLARADARDRLQAGFSKLQQAQAKARTQLDHAAQAGQDTWKTTARQTEQAVTDVGAQLQALVEQVQEQVGKAAPAARKAWSTFLDEWNRERTDRERLLDDG